MKIKEKRKQKNEKATKEAEKQPNKTLYNRMFKQNLKIHNM